jgi:NADPH:quinone reductase-like Zn-dependent oxidoreductase
MKAVVFETYGPPDVLKLKDIPKPEPAADEVLIRVKSASVNPADWHILRAAPFFSRFTTGLLKPKQPILGIDAAGIVETVGSEVTDLKQGDEIFGDCNLGGAFAEYACVKTGDLCKKPANCTFEEVATIPVAGLTALQALRDAGQIQPGQHVLINGSSGGIGVFAVQIAKSFSTNVTAVCSTKNLEFVKSLGADNVIDYTQVDISKLPQKFDVVLDNVGNLAVFTLLGLLKPVGKAVVTGYTSFSRMFRVGMASVLRSKRNNRQIGIMIMKRSRPDDLETVAEMIASGKIKVVIDQRFRLDETPEAVRYLETGHVRGKVVINIDHESSPGRKN